MNKRLPYIDLSQYDFGNIQSNEQLADEYARLGRLSSYSINPDDYKATVSDMLPDALSAASSGASIGSMIHPVYGTIAGGLIGGGASMLKSYIDSEELQNKAALQNKINKAYADDAYKRLGYSADILQDNLFRESEAHVVENGGAIERKQMSLKEFSDMVSKKKTGNNYSDNSRVVRTYCKGGVKISFK